MSDTKEETSSSESVDRATDGQAIGFLDLFAISLNVVSVVPSVASVLMFSLPGGGTHGMTWAWLVCSVFVTVIALAVIQFLGASPTSAGVYQRTYTISQSKHRVAISRVVGYANIIGNIASVASICWAVSSHIMAAAFVGSGFVGTRAEIFGVYLAVLLLQLLVYVLVPTVKSGAARFFMLGNILLWVALIVALPSATPKPLNTPKFVFGTFTNVNKAWDNNVFAFLLTFVGPFWALGRPIVTVHMTDIARKPKQHIAYAVVAATLVNAIMAIAFNVALAFSMGNNLRAVLNVPHGEPISAILSHAFGVKGTLATYAFIILLQFHAGTTMLSATSIHASEFIHDTRPSLSADTADEASRARARAAIACSSLLISAFLGLLALAGTGAINSLFATAVVGHLLAFTIAIVSSKFGDKSAKVGSVSAIPLGCLESPISVIAIILMTVLSVFFLFPQSQHPSPGNVNYAVVIIAGEIMIWAILSRFYK